MLRLLIAEAACIHERNGRPMRNWNEQSDEERKALLYGMGVDDDMAARPIIGIINSWNEMNPGHFHLNEVIPEIKRAVEEAGGCLACCLPRESVTACVRTRRGTGIRCLPGI